MDLGNSSQVMYILQSIYHAGGVMYNSYFGCTGLNKQVEGEKLHFCPADRWRLQFPRQLLLQVVVL